jgi:hypothetical protein
MNDDETVVDQLARRAYELAGQRSLDSVVMNPFSTLRKLATGGDDPKRVDELVRMANGERSLLMAARQRVRELYEGARDVEKAQSLLMSAVFAGRKRT